MRKRLDVYQAQTRPLVEFYGQWATSGDAMAPKYHKVSGIGSVDEIASRVLSALES